MNATLDSLESQFSFKVVKLQQKLEALSMEIEAACQEWDELADRLDEIESESRDALKGKREDYGGYHGV